MNAISATIHSYPHSRLSATDLRKDSPNQPHILLLSLPLISRHLAGLVGTEMTSTLNLKFKDLSL